MVELDYTREKETQEGKLTGRLAVEEVLKIGRERYVYMFKCGMQDRDIDEQNTIIKYSEMGASFWKDLVAPISAATDYCRRFLQMSLICMFLLHFTPLVIWSGNKKAFG